MRNTPVPKLLLKFLPFVFGIGLVAATLVPLSNIAAQEGEDPPGYSDYAESGDREVPLSGQSSPVYGPSSMDASLVFFSDRFVFDSVWPGLPLEDFEATLVPPSSVLACSGTISSQTDDACFGPGSIRPGLVISPTGAQYVVLTQGFLSMPSAVVGPNFFVDDTHMFFTDTVQAVGLDFLDALSVVTITVDVFGPGGEYLGSDMVSDVGSTPVFWGVSSNSTPIEHLFITADGGSEELLDNVAFGGVAYMTHDCDVPSNPVANCSFETGDFTGWLPTDLANPFFPLQVNGALVQPWPNFFFSQPSHGAYAALNGFDGASPGLIQLAQDISLPGWSTELLFDYRAAWDFSVGAVATQDRHFMVNIEPAGGGAPLQSTTLLTAPAGSVVTDTGNLVGNVDLSSFAGSDVRLNFLWDVPESSTGPAFFQLDNVLVEVVPPDIEIDPMALTSTHASPPEMVVQTLTISNTGGSELNWSLFEETTRVVLDDQPAGSFERGIHPPSTGAAPAGEDSGDKPAPIINVPLGTRAYGWNALNGPYYTIFNLDSPEALLNITDFYPGGVFIGAGEYQDDRVYMIDVGNNMWELDADTGAIRNTYTATAPTGGETYTGLAIDPTTAQAYAASTSVTTSTLFTIDLPSGVASEVGSITNSPGMIALAFDPAGTLYGYDIVTDELLSIDKATGAGTVIGPIGFDANFGQGMAYDPATDTIYMTAFNNSTFQAELRAVNTATGNTTFLGLLGESLPGGLNQVSWLGLGRPCIGGNLPWLSVGPASGTIPGGGVTAVDVTFDSHGLASGTYVGDLCIDSSDPDEAQLRVPVTLTVEDYELYLPVVIKNGSPALKPEAVPARLGWLPLVGFGLLILPLWRRR